MRQFVGGKLGIDATAKLPDEGGRDWPPEIEMSAEIRALVDRRWAEYGLDAARPAAAHAIRHSSGPGCLRRRSRYL